MAKNTFNIPYTEIIERTQKLARSPKNTPEKIRGLAQDVYLRDIVGKYDWNFLITGSSLTTIANVKDGTISINTGDTTATFSSAFSATSGMIGRKTKISGNEAVYRVTAISNGSVTISPSFEGSRNASGDSFNMFQDEYPVAWNFDRFPKDGGFYKWTGGRKEVRPEWAYQEQLEDYSSSPSIPGHVRLVGRNSGGDQLIQLNPPPLDRRNYSYDYFHIPTPMSETSAGTIKSIGAQATTVAGNTDCRFNEATTGDWFRVDALGQGNDSQWYRIISIANDSSLTLQTAFANTAITSSASYTISSIPELPPRMHPAIIYGTILGITIDQADPSAEFYKLKYDEIMLDSKRIYVSRVYSQEVEGIYEDWNYRR